MDPVITGQLGREPPLVRYLGDFLADLANAGASRHTLRACRCDLLQFAAHHDGEITELTFVAPPRPAAHLAVQLGDEQPVSLRALIDHAF